VVPELKDKKPPSVFVSRELSFKFPRRLTNIKVRLPLRNGVIRRLLLLLTPHLNQLLDRSMAPNLPLQQKHPLPRNPSILRRLDSNLHTIRMRHQELGVRRLERICHLLNIVRRAGAGNFSSDAQSGVHCDRVPDAILAEERDGVAFLQAIAFLEGCAEVRGGFFDLQPVQALFGEGVGVAG
jgi:hypothetical protein